MLRLLAMLIALVPVSSFAQTRIAGDWKLNLQCNYWALWTDDTLSISSEGGGSGTSARMGAVSVSRSGNQLIAKGATATWSGQVSGNTWTGFWDPGGYTGGRCSFSAVRTPTGEEKPVQGGPVRRQPEKTDPGDPNQCIREAGRSTSNSTGVTKLYRIKLRNVCKKSIPILVETCASRSDCSWGNNFVGSLSTETIDSFIRFPAWKIR